MEDYNGGPWRSNPGYGDMEKLAREIRDRDILPGIWVRLLEDHSDSIPSAWRLSHNGALDPSVPEVLSQIRETVRTIGSWGYRLLKHDFSTFDLFGRWGFQMEGEMAAPGWSFADRSRTSAEIIKDLYRAILEAGQEQEMIILGCNTIGHLGAGLMHAHRTGDDTSGLRWERTLRTGVNTLAFCLPQHRTFYDIDADCLGITPAIPWAYNRQWGELLAASGTPLFFSCAPGTLTPEQKADLSSFLALSSDPPTGAEPLDWMDTPLPQTWRLGGKQRAFSWYEPSGLLAGTRVPDWDAL